MHNEIRDFFARMAQGKPDAFAARKVLECGSYDINGNPRGFFPDAQEYVGLDWRPGPKVDAVSLVHEYVEKPNGYFDFVIATSLLEHDPHWELSIARMVDLTAEGGSILITCGGPGFHEHEIETAPAAEDLPPGTYYGNRTANDIVSELTACGRFLFIVVEDDPTIHDIRVFAYHHLPPRAGLEGAAC